MARLPDCTTVWSSCSFSRAETSPGGYRVISTAETSARLSRRRLTAACMARAASGASSMKASPTSRVMMLPPASLLRRPPPQIDHAHAEVGEQGGDADHGHRERHDEGVVVLHVAELVGQHALELDPVHLLRAARS